MFFLERLSGPDRMGPSGNAGSQPLKGLGFGPCLARTFSLVSENKIFLSFHFCLFSHGRAKVLDAFVFVPIYTVQFHLRIMLELCSLFVAKVLDAFFFVPIYTVQFHLRIMLELCSLFVAKVLDAFFFVPIYTVQFHLRIMLELCSLFVAKVLDAFFFVPIYTVQFHLRIMLELCSLFVVFGSKVGVKQKVFFLLRT